MPLPLAASTSCSSHDVLRSWRGRRAIAMWRSRSQAAAFCSALISLQPEARLDVAADAEVVPGAPFRPVPGERWPPCACRARGSPGTCARRRGSRRRERASFSRADNGIGYGGRTDERRAGQNRAAPIEHGATCVATWALEASYLGLRCQPTPTLPAMRWSPACAPSGLRDEQRTSFGRRRARAISTSVAASRVLDRRIGARLDQQVQGFQPLQPRGVEDRRLAMGPEIEPRLGRQQVSAQHGIVAPHRRPQRIQLASAPRFRRNRTKGRFSPRETAYHSGVARKSPSASFIGTAASSRGAALERSAVTVLMPLGSPRPLPPGFTAQAMCSAMRPFGIGRLGERGRRLQHGFDGCGIPALRSIEQRCLRRRSHRLPSDSGRPTLLLFMAVIQPARARLLSAGSSA